MNSLRSIARKRGLISLLILLAGSPVIGQTNFSTLQTNGPASNRLNVVFLAEGYTSGQFGQFLVDATNAMNSLFAAAPFTEYRPYCNTYAIAVASVQSGSDHPNSSLFVNTYFNSSYDTNANYLVTIPSGVNGQGKVTALLNTYVPGCDLAVLLVNDSTLGGSDGGGLTAIVPMHFAMSDFLVHEAGHVLAGLGDEYTDAYPGYPDIEEPNTTRETNRAAIKWNAWISTNTPVPTPPTTEYSGVVGLFEGAHYHPTGWYRPRINCRMQSQYTPFFCEICAEAIVLAIYKQARPIASSFPASTNVVVTDAAALNFSLTILQPATHTLNIQWLTNSVAVPGATNTAFSILPAALGNGTNTVQGNVSDPTPLVRTDPTNLLSQSRAWTVSVSVPQLQLSHARWLGAGKFAFRVSGVAPQGFAIQVSTNLTAWTSLTTNNLTGGVFEYTNTVGAGLLNRAYRAVTPPK